MGGGHGVQRTSPREKDGRAYHEPITLRKKRGVSLGRARRICHVRGVGKGVREKGGRVFERRFVTGKN